MVEKILFKPGAVEEAESYYNRLHVSGNQNKIVSNLADIIAQHVPIPARAIKGFFWRVSKAYQVEHHMAAKEAEKLTPAERIEGFKTQIKMLKEELTKSLVDQEHEPILDEALNKAMSVYLEKYANR